MDKRTIKTISGIAGGCILLYWLLQNLGVVWGFLGSLFKLMGPFLLGAVIAFVLNLPMRSIEKHLPKKLKGFRRPAAILLTLLLFVGVLAVVLLLLFPQLTATVRIIAQKLPVFWDNAVQMLSDALVQYPVLENWLDNASTMDWQKLVETVFEWAKRGGIALVGGAATAATGIVSGVLDFFIGMIFALYLLSQKETLQRQSKMLLYAYLPERRAAQIISISRLTFKTFSNFLSGQCLEACILGSMFAVSMLIFRMPFVALISVLVAVTALVPVFGAFIGCFVGAFLILVQNPMQAVWFVVLFLALQQLEGNLIYPRVVGSSVGLPSIWVLLAVTLGGSTLGVLGMLIMIPLFSVLYTLLRSSTHSRLRYREVPKEAYLEQADEKPCKAPAASSKK